MVSEPSEHQGTRNALMAAFGRCQDVEIPADWARLLARLR
jgi:hypothetical protein